MAGLGGPSAHLATDQTRTEEKLTQADEPVQSFSVLSVARAGDALLTSCTHFLFVSSVLFRRLILGPCLIRVRSAFHQWLNNRYLSLFPKITQSAAYVFEFAKPRKTDGLEEPRHRAISDLAVDGCCRRRGMHNRGHPRFLRRAQYGSERPHWMGGLQTIRSC